MIKIKKFLSAILSAIIVFSFAGCVKNTNKVSTANTVTATEARGTEENLKNDTSIKLSKLNITLPANWVRKGNDEEVFFEDENKQTVGGIYLVGYYGEDKPTLPNHSEILDSKEIDINLGKGKIFTLKRSNPAAANNNKEWNEIHAIIPLEKKSIAYDIWIKSNNDLNLSNLKLLGIIKSIQ